MTATSLIPLGRGLTLRGVLDSEWSKLWSLRSTGVITLGLVVVPLVAGVIRAAIADPAWVEDADGVAASLESIALGVLPLSFVAAMLGLVAMGAELVEDVLSGTFIASPRRRQVVISKCAIVFVVAFGAALSGLAAAALTSALMLQAKGHEQLPYGQVIEVVLVGALAAASMSVMGVAVAVLARTMTSAALHLAVLLAVAPALLGLVGGRPAQGVSDLLPATAIQGAVTRHPAMPFTIEGALPSTLHWVGALGVVLAWSAAYIVFATMAIARRQVSETRVPGVAVAPERRNTTSRAVGLSFRGAVRSEALKAVTLPSTRWLLGLSAAVFVVVVLVSASRAEVVLSEPVLPGDRALAIWWIQVTLLTSGAGLAQLLMAAFGAFAITSEFTVGSIAPTLAAVPSRSMAFKAKAVVVAALAAVAAVAMAGSAAVLTMLVLRQRGIEAALVWPVLESIMRCAVVLTLLALTGFALGVLLRSPLASLAAVVSILVLVPSVLSPLQFMTRGTPIVMIANAVEFFPALPTAITVLPGNSAWPQFLDGGVLQLHPDQALLVIVGWAALSLTVAGVSFSRRSV